MLCPQTITFVSLISNLWLETDIRLEISCYFACKVVIKLVQFCTVLTVFNILGLDSSFAVSEKLCSSGKVIFGIVKSTFPNTVGLCLP